MLLRIFARLMEITLERLNKVPEMNLCAFLNATGISLLPPVPARVPLTFALISSNAPIFVPQGTRAGTAPAGGQDPIDFETEADLTILPASLTSAWVVDPGWDRYSYNSRFIDAEGRGEFTPFVGAKRLSHSLYLGDRTLLVFQRAKVTMMFGSGSAELPNLWEKVAWKYASGASTSEDVKCTVAATDGRIEIAFTDPLESINETTLEGPSESPELRKGQRLRWLEGRLRSPLPEAPSLSQLRCSDIKVQVRCDGFAPDLAFSNLVPVDVTVPFYPFGDNPKVGDAFYLSCTEALIKSQVELGIDFESANLKGPTLKAEAFDGVAWNGIILKDVTPPAEVSKKWRIVLADPFARLAKINGKEGYWIRLRIESGDYGQPAEYVPVDGDPKNGYKLKEGTGNLNPPLVTNLTLSYVASGTPEAIVTQNGFFLTDETSANAGGFNPFAEVQDLPATHADTGPSFYLGFDTVFREEPITIFFTVTPRSFTGTSGPLVMPAERMEVIAPLVRWECFNGAGWVGLSVLDQTAQFTQSGTVEILTPADIAPLAKFDLRELYWIRATLTSAGPAGDANRSLRDDPIATPRLSAIYLNTIPAVQAVTVTKEIVGSGNGLPGQAFRLSQSPVLGGPEILVLEPELPSAVERDELQRDEGAAAVQQTINPATGEAEIWIRWHEVSSFHGSGPHSRHYTLDHGTGEVVFGDGSSGLLPPLGTNSIVANYRVGVGSAGNVLEGAVVQLKSPVPGIVSVSNRLRADGGADLETAEIVRRRGPQTLRHRGRALSRTDFEWMALEAAGTRLARVVCLPNTNRDLAFEPGWVTLVIVPHGTERRLTPSVELIRLVEESVGSRAFAGLENLSRINVVGPGYIEVSVDAEIAVGDLRRASQVKRDVTDALDRFLHPLTGGPDGDGWELGRNVFASEIASVIQAVPGVDYLRDLRLIPSQAQSRIEIPPTVFYQDLPEGSLVVSPRTGGRGEGGRPVGGKSALLAERILAGTEARWLRIRGFKAEDRVIRGLDPSLRNATLNLPLTITSVSTANGLTIGIDTHDVDPPEEGTLLTTPDDRLRLPISALGTEPSASRFLVLDDFSSSDSVQILLPDRSELTGVPLLEIKQVLPASEIVYLGGIFLVCSGRHRITIRATTLAAA
jgi:uncharacterized phage protein gp47/JayE